MKIKEKLNYLIEHHYEEFIKAQSEAIWTLDKKYSIVCACGRLATGFHTSQCKKFNDEVDKETIKILEKYLK